ncbi:hypothetical protein GDO81_003434 [Engystomops pustulosus]|uniref:Uncharacterized protein n=1 Tax=Engystomops pustulosus TaxID=76066 RepID=A0AAV7A1X3_ENGPU|nr:hypothetical protein GDO81_003434 [Engystomops pustulosus]
MGSHNIISGYKGRELRACLSIRSHLWHSSRGSWEEPSQKPSEIIFSVGNSYVGGNLRSIMCLCFILTPPHRWGWKIVLIPVCQRVQA